MRENEVEERIRDERKDKKEKEKDVRVDLLAINPVVTSPLREMNKSIKDEEKKGLQCCVG